MDRGRTVRQGKGIFAGLFRVYCFGSSGPPHAHLQRRMRPSRRSSRPRPRPPATSRHRVWPLRPLFEHGRGGAPCLATSRKGSDTLREESLGSVFQAEKTKEHAHLFSTGPGRTALLAAILHHTSSPMYPRVDWLFCYTRSIIFSERWRPQGTESTGIHGTRQDQGLVRAVSASARLLCEDVDGQRCAVGREAAGNAGLGT